jgi:hypothetical protein
MSLDCLDLFPSDFFVYSLNRFYYMDFLVFGIITTLFVSLVVEGPSNKVMSELRSRIVLGRWHITLVGDYKRAFAILLTSGPCCHQLSIQLASGVQPNGPCVRPRQSTTGVNVPEPAATPSSAFAAVAAHNQKVSATPQRDGRKPNILVIMGDDIGWFNPSCYNHGIMGYKTPNIDRIAKEGVMFTDAYGQQSCTAGRAAFITGQCPKRTGLLKIGMPGDPIGLQKEDPTIAELLKPLGYVTGQFGKNHLGDLDQFLPTNHGFDEFFGNLYHLNAEEEPEQESSKCTTMPMKNALSPIQSRPRYFAIRSS